MSDLVQLSLFMVTTVDPPWRDNRDAMAYPLLSLEKRRTTPIEYERNGVSIEVQAPSKLGLASIWDWDLIIFAASHLNQAIEDGRKPAPRISFVPYDCLKQIGRPIGGAHYKRLAEAIRRLRATTIITNIRFEDAVGEDDDAILGEERPFSWLTDYRLPKKYRPRVYTTPDDITHITPQDHKGEPDPTRPWEIKLSPWLYRAIVRQRDLLAVHPDYFLLTGGVERWLYRLSRKAVPEKVEPPEFRFRLKTLFETSGLTGRLRDFRGKIERIEAEGPLPEYSVRVERDGRDEMVTLYRDPAKPGRVARPMTASKQVRIEPDSLSAITPQPIIAVEQIRGARTGRGALPAPEGTTPQEEAVRRLELAYRELATAAYCSDREGAWREELLREARGLLGDLVSGLRQRATYAPPDGTCGQPRPGAAPPTDLGTALRAFLEEVLRAQ